MTCMHHFNFNQVFLGWSIYRIWCHSQCFFNILQSQGWHSISFLVSMCHCSFQSKTRVLGMNFHQNLCLRSCNLAKMSENWAWKIWLGLWRWRRAWNRGSSEWKKKWSEKGGFEGSAYPYYFPMWVPSPPSPPPPGLQWRKRRNWSCTR